MTTARLGSAERPLQLRPGETDRFYFLFDRYLDDGDALTGTPTVESPGVTVSGASRNSAPLTYQGVEYSINTVVYVDVSGITRGEKVEVICTCLTTAGRVAVDSFWLEGARAY